jgi:putative copper resistance protein D
VPPPSLSGALAAWTFDPVTTAVVLLMLVGCLAAARRGGRLPGWRWALLGAGCAVALIAADGWPGAYAASLAWVFVVRLCALLLGAPALVAFARPELLLPESWRRRRPLGRAGRALGHPLVGPLLLPVLIGVVIFTPLFTLAVRDRPVTWALDGVLLIVGTVLAAPLARAGEQDSSLRMGVVLFVGLFELLIDAIPGVALRLDGHVVPAVAALAAHRGGPPNALHDQQLAGAVLWGVAELIDLPFLLVVFRQWVRADQHEATVVDRRVAERGTDPAESDRERPWWEQDATVFGDHRRRELQGRRDPQDS